MASDAPVQASDAPAQQPTPQQKPTRVSLSYEEISKLFSLPIAEAASILGVCTSVLKRICRTHGIVRWPYRKLVSGKAGDDTKGPDRDKAKELLELSKIAKQKASSASGPSLVSSSTSPGAPKSQQGSSKAGQISISPPAAGKQNAPPSLAQGSQAKAIPSYMDDFKYGFPSSGLSCETMKWWGTSSDADCVPAKDGSHESTTHEPSKGLTDDDELDWGADEVEADGTVTAEASAQLCSLRRKAVDDGRKLLNGDNRRGQEFSRLNKRQKLALAQVFGASLPDVVFLVSSE